MQQDPDSKIRQYILKKQQQRERAKQLRAARRNKEYKPDKGNQYQNKYRNNKRIVADPFDPISNKENTNYANVQQSYNKNHHIKPSYHTQLSSSLDNQQLHPYDNHNQQQPNHSIDMQQILSMMEEFRGQINTLQSEVTNLKMENKQLTKVIVELKNQPHTNQQSNCMNQHTQHINESMPSHQTYQNTHTISYSDNLSNTYPSSSMQCKQRNNERAPKIDMSKSLKNLKLKRKRNNVSNSQRRMNQQYSRRDNIPEVESYNHMANENEYDEYNAPNKMSHSSSANVFIDKLSETENFSEEIQRIPCKQCGRKFIEKALERHIKICKKVFGDKRKVFDTKSQRLDNDAKNAQSNCDEYKLKMKRKKAKRNWKAKSSMLRQAIAASKQNSTSGSNYPPMVDDRVECPHCGRRFAEATAERHIPKCRDIISKPKTLRRKRY